MNQRTGTLLLLLILLLGFAGFLIYDYKNSNHFGFRKDEPKSNWTWEDDWKANPIEQPKEQPKKPETPKEQVVAGTYAEAIKKAAELKMSVLVFFESDWCSWCKKLKSETLSDAKVKEAMKKYIVVFVDTGKDRAAAKKFGVRYLPSYVVTNDKEEKVKSDGGFKTADEFLRWLGTQPDQVKPDPKQPEKKVQPPQPKGEDNTPPPQGRRFRRPQQCSDIDEKDQK